jgi:hypothetical protein
MHRKSDLTQGVNDFDTRCKPLLGNAQKKLDTRWSRSHLVSSFFCALPNSGLHLVSKSFGSCMAWINGVHSICSSSLLFVSNLVIPCLKVVYSMCPSILLLRFKDVYFTMHRKSDLTQGVNDFDTKCKPLLGNAQKKRLDTRCERLWDKE